MWPKFYDNCFFSTTKKAESQLLIELVSHPDLNETTDEIKTYEAETYIQGILHNMKLWTIRQSLVKLLHLFRAVESKKESLMDSSNMIDQYSIKVEVFKVIYFFLVQKPQKLTRYDLCERLLPALWPKSFNLHPEQG